MSVQAFFEAMKAMTPADARIMACQFRGDPGDDIKGKWRARVVNDLSTVDEQANVYFCVSAMKKNARGEFRRRKENFSAGLLLMIDDLGDGPAAKFPMSTIDALPPTALIETSKDNFQAVYFFDEPIVELRLFQRLITAFIERKFLGADPGMAGVNRVFRPPIGVNGKPKHDGWRVRLAEWAPNHRYSPETIAEAFGLVLAPPGRPIPRGATRSVEQAQREFKLIKEALRDAGMLKGEEHDLGGWLDVQCPWTNEHTNALDNGAAICYPNEENGLTGGFKCHHGSCKGRGWRAMTDWLADEVTALLRVVNDNAPEDINELFRR